MRIQKAPSPPPIPWKTLSDEEREEILPHQHQQDEDGPDHGLTLNSQAQQLAQVGLRGMFRYPGIPVSFSGSSSASSSASASARVLRSSSGSTSGSDQSPTWRRDNTSTASTSASASASLSLPDYSYPSYPTYRQERLHRERTWDYGHGYARGYGYSSDNDGVGVGVGTAIRSIGSQTQSFLSSSLPSLVSHSGSVSVSCYGTEIETESRSGSASTLAAFTTCNATAAAAAAAAITVGTDTDNVPDEPSSGALSSSSICRDGGSTRRFSSVDALEASVKDACKGGGTRDTGICSGRSSLHWDRDRSQSDRRRCSVRIACILVLVPVVAVIAWACVPAWRPNRHQEIHGSNANSNSNSNNDALTPDPDPDPVVALCPISSFLVTVTDHTSNVSNDVDDDRVSWGLRTAGRNDPRHPDNSTSASTSTIQDAAVPTVSRTLNQDEKELLGELQKLLAPSFQRLLSQNEQGQGQGQTPCFPFTLAQRETLIWMVKRIMERTDENKNISEDSQLDNVRPSSQAEAEDYSASSTNSSTGDAPPKTNSSASILLSLQLDRFDSNEWLQAFVVSLLARTWNVLSNDKNAKAEDTNSTASTSTVVLTTPTNNVRAQFVPESPLNLCGWQGLGCTGDGRLMSLQWNEKSLDLTGSIPTELALLTHLALLDLSSSPNLEGTFPSSLWGRNMKLQALYLETTGLTGRLPQPSEGLSLTDLRLSSTPGIQQYGLPTAQFFQRMSHLKWFQWSQETGVKDDAAAAETFTEASSGTIPSELGLLTRLEGLSLDGNGFSGTVPIEIGKLTLLESLDLGHNHLNSGSLPTEIGRLVHLQWLSLQNSGLRGHLPTEIAALPHLTWLQLGGGNNDFEGSTLAALLRSLPLHCSCGSWTNPTVPIGSSSPTPLLCSCAVDPLDGD